MNETMEYITEDWETGTVIDEFPTREAALREIAEYEAADRGDGSYEDGFYAIRHGGEAERVWDAVSAVARMEAARELGRSRSERKAQAARENGRKGGRPRKSENK